MAVVTVSSVDNTDFSDFLRYSEGGYRNEPFSATLAGTYAQADGIEVKAGDLGVNVIRNLRECYVDDSSGAFYPCHVVPPNAVTGNTEYLVMILPKVHPTTGVVTAPNGVDFTGDLLVGELVADGA